MRPSHRQRLNQRCEQRRLQLSAVQADCLIQYVELLWYWRRHINLTGLQDLEHIIDVLLGESLDFLQPDLLPPHTRVLDLGTGAGVPGIPLAVCAPYLHCTLLDRSEKKITFLRRVVSQLRLENCQPLCSTAEALARRLPAALPFDAVVTRGVGRVALLLSLAAPLLRPGGILVLRKPLGAPEIAEAAPLLSAGGWESCPTVPVVSEGQVQWGLLLYRRVAMPRTSE
jgi:16S rRNA (guanine527-N7)-methyltransferase